MYITCENSVFIADIGTSFTKSGPSTSITPHYLFPTPPCLSYSKITDLPLYFSLIPSFHTILLPLNIHQKKFQTQIIDHVFNNGTENILFVDSMILDLFSYGKTTGIVIKLGESICISAIIDGQVKVRRERDYGGIEMTNEFMKYMQECDKLDNTTIQEVKPADNEVNEEPTYSKSQITHFELIRMLKETAFSVKDDVFVFKEKIYKKEPIKSKLISDLCRDIKDHVKEIIEACDMESKNLLLSNVVLSGGCANILDLSEEITSILCEIYPPSKVKVVHEKCWQTYQGAAVFGSLGSTRCLFIGRKDYEEYGSGVLQRKNFL